MKDQDDPQSVDLYALRQARPGPSGDRGGAMTNPERQRAYRLCVKAGQTVDKNHPTPGDFPGEIDSLRKALDSTVQHRNQLLLEVHDLKQQVERLKSVTVTEKAGQGAISKYC